VNPVRILQSVNPTHSARRTQSRIFLTGGGIRPEMILFGDDVPDHREQSAQSFQDSDDVPDHREQSAQSFQDRIIFSDRDPG
jgi:hypothetical protein